MIKEITLQNGLKVILVQDPTSTLVSAKTFVRAGSIDEDPLLGSGISHNLEHLVAGGTTTARSESEYRQLIAKLGGAFNAYTTLDHTCYYINTTPSELKTAISMLSEWMSGCAFTDAEFNRERDVIIKEIEKDNASISRKFYQFTTENFYKNNPIRYPVIGYLESFKRLTRDQVMAYYHSRYVPTNMILVVGGNFNEQDILTHIKDTFGKMKSIAPPKHIVFDEPQPFSPRTQITEAKTSVTYLSVRFPSITLFSHDLCAIDLLEFILSEGEDSILHKRLVDEKKLAYSVRASSYTPSFTSGYFEIVCEIDQDKIEAVKKEIATILSEVKKGKFNDALLKRAKKQKLAEDIFSIQTIDDKVSRIGTGMLYGHTPYFYDEYVKNFKDVKKEDVVRVANHYLNPSRMVTSIMIPESKTTSKNTETTQLPELKTPDLKTLSNGVKVLLYPDHSIPQVFSKMYVIGGLRAESPSQNGIGNLLADLIGKASKKYTKNDIQKIVDDHGASLSGASGQNTFAYSLECLSEDFSTLFPLFTETLINATFIDTNELNESKRKILKSISQRKDDWFRYGSYLTKKEVFKNHPYGTPIIGEKETLSSLELADVQAHYTKLMNPENMIISVFGDFDEKTALKHIDKTFSKLVKPKNFFDPFIPITRTQNNATKNTETPIPQDVAALFITFDGLTFKDTNENLKLDLVDAVLSGASYPGGRFHHILRDKGYVYMVHADNQPGVEPGIFIAYALTSKDKIDDVQKIMLDQIEDVKNTPISDKEFSEAIAQLRYSYQDRIAALDSKLAIFSTDVLFKLGKDHYLTLLKQIETLTKKDIQNTIKKYLNHPQIFKYLGK